jgi:hypothetical protein
MKPTKQDILNHFKPNDKIQHINDKYVTCFFSDITMIWDNGTGGWNGFIKDGGIIILWSGKTKKYASTI